jgi:hypothetical protein
MTQAANKRHDFGFRLILPAIDNPLATTLRTDKSGSAELLALAGIRSGIRYMILRRAPQ